MVPQNFNRTNLSFVYFLIIYSSVSKALFLDIWSPGSRLVSSGRQKLNKSEIYPPNIVNLFMQRQTFVFQLCFLLWIWNPLY